MPRWPDVSKQRRCEQQRAGNRRAIGAAQRRSSDLIGDRTRRRSAIDNPPGHDDALVLHAGPFEIGDGDLAMHALLQRVEKFRRRQAEDVALALQRLLVRIHRVGNIDGDDEFDVDIGLFEVTRCLLCEPRFRNAGAKHAAPYRSGPSYGEQGQDGNALSLHREFSCRGDVRMH